MYIPILPDYVDIRSNSTLAITFILQVSKSFWTLALGHSDGSQNYINILKLNKLSNHIHILSMKMLKVLQSKFSSLKAVSPLDGRYEKVSSALGIYFSEMALMKYRIIVESQWLLHLLKNQIVPLERGTSYDQIQSQLKLLIKGFDLKSAQRIKQIEATTNHDLKSVEYFMKQNLTIYREHIHFCCTSQDINNLSYSLMLKDSLQAVIVPKIEQIKEQLIDKSERWADAAMLAHTHGQPASPTTIGKQYANFAYRIAKQVIKIKSVQIQGKFNGAVGNYNAHHFSYPNINWPLICQSFVEDRLKLKFNPYTTQIEPHDSLCRVFSEVGTTNTILIGLCKDSWQYISKGYLKQKSKQGEVGSSTMPHKVNPIDFENCQGNLGLANSIIDHFRNKLPMSRQQRDLSDSTVLRNQGAALAYSLIGYSSLSKGFSKVDANKELLEQELSHHYQVITQAIQTELRKVGYPQPYELLKKWSRGKSFTLQSKNSLLQELKDKIPSNSYKKINDLTPSTYLGSAVSLAKSIRLAINK